jgi:hypothetical protein
LGREQPQRSATIREGWSLPPITNRDQKAAEIHRFACPGSGRNPGTGEAITIAASKKLTFTPAKTIRDALNAATPDRAAAAE